MVTRSFQRCSPLPLLLVAALPGTAAAQPFVIADLAPGIVSSDERDPSDFLSLGDVALFVGRLEDRENGELWRSDGTPEGTFLLADLCAGPCDSVYAPIGTVGGHHLFSARLTSTAREDWLFRTDGTVAGTSVVAGPFSELEPFGTAEEFLFFRVEELEGSSIHSWLVRWRPGGALEVLGQVDRAIAYDIVASGSRLFLSGTGALWMVDGTEDGIRSVDGFARALHPLAGGVVYWKSDGLWFTDGGAPRQLATSDEVLQPHDVHSASDGRGRIYFAFGNFPGGDHLWVTDGTVAGSRRLLAPQHNMGIGPLGAGSGRAFFGASDGVSTELWTSDGTPLGTRRLADLCPGACSSAPRSFESFSTGVLFVAEQDEDSTGIWFVDSTSLAVTNLLEERFFFDATEPLAPVLHVGDDAYFVWDFHLWRIDRTLSLTQVHPAEKDFARAGSWILFEAGFSLWRTDGTTAGTEPVPAAASPRDGNPHGLVAFAGRVCFWTWTGWCADPGATDLLGVDASGEALFVPLDGRLLAVTGDGVYAGDDVSTSKLMESFDIDVESSAVLGDRLIFFEESIGGGGLWRSDGTAEGTQLVTAPVRPRSPVTRFGDRLIFVAGGLAGPLRVWISDGTAAGTFALPVEKPPSSEFAAVEFRGEAWFSVDNEIWRSDGTVEGTSLAFELLVSQTPTSLFATSERLLIDHETFAGRALWSTDGSSPPQQILELDEGHTPIEVLSLGDRIFFAAGHPELGRELWVSDGTAAGTFVLDVAPGLASSTPTHLTAIDGLVFFAASDLAHGSELWWTDGTPEGTRRVFDLAPGPASSFPDEMTLIGDLLYFVADDGIVGRELWAIPWVQALAGGPCEPSATRLCLGGGRFAVTVRWRDQFNGGEGAGRVVTLPGSDQSGAFWFFDPGNVELIVKALDGTPVNGHHWLFYGALSTVEYTVTVLDTQTGQTRRYHNPPGEQCGRGDTTAFPNVPGVRQAAGGTASAATAASELCGGPNALCLLGGSLRVEVDWHDPRSGGRGTGVPIPGTDNSGYFWFFDDENVELVVKALDGTTVNGHRWVFYGGLSDVEYEIRVTETATGATRTYRNPFGEICGGADTTAF